MVEGVGRPEHKHDDAKIPEASRNRGGTGAGGAAQNVAARNIPPQNIPADQNEEPLPPLRLQRQPPGFYDASTSRRSGGNARSEGNTR